MEETILKEMPVSKCIKTRKSFRSFLDKPIEARKLDKILEAGYFAPSAGGIHWINVILIQKKEAIKKILDCNGEYVTSKRITTILKEKPEYLHNAAAIIVVSADLDKYRNEYADLIEGNGSSKWYNLPIGELFSVNDADLAALSMILQAHALGIGVCWIGHIKEKRIKELLKLEGEIMPICLLLMGYPDAKGESEIRRILKERRKAFPEPPPPNRIFFEDEYGKEPKRIKNIEKQIRGILEQKRASESSRS